MGESTNEFDEVEESDEVEWRVIKFKYGRWGI
jgi:hypothetical protein